jgi:hypothetical protein
MIQAVDRALRLLSEVRDHPGISLSELSGATLGAQVGTTSYRAIVEQIEPDRERGHPHPADVPHATRADDPMTAAQPTTPDAGPGTTAVAGQNLGAGRPERSIHAVHVATRIGRSVALGVGLLFLLAPRLLLAAFGMNDPIVVAIGVQLLAFLAVSGPFIAVALVYTGGLQGTGDTKSPFYISLVSQIVVPLGLCTFFQATRGLTPGDIWLGIVVGHAPRCARRVLRVRQGRWREIVVEIGGGVPVGAREAAAGGGKRG